MPHTPYCPICFSSFNTTKRISLPCECTCCHSCLNDWMALKIREPSFSFKESVPCFSQRCSGKFQVQSIYYRLPKSARQQLDKELLNSYLIRTSDIRKCPNVKCSYAGIIDTSAKCSQPLQCKACLTIWRDPLHFSSSEKLLSVVSKTKTRRNEAFSALWKGLWTKRCPECQVPIQKTGGCAHMKCSHCGASFCWTCSGRHDNSKHALNFTISAIPFVILVIIALYALYQVAWVYSTVDAVMNNVVKPIMRWCWYLIWFGFLCLFCSILVNTACVLGYFLHQTFTKGPQKTQFKPIELLGMILMICGILYYFGYPKIILLVGLVEIPIILIAMLVRRRSRDANRQVYKTDWRAHNTKRQVYKGDWKSDSRSNHYWKETSRSNKSMKKAAYKFPAFHRH